MLVLGRGLGSFSFYNFGHHCFSLCLPSSLMLRVVHVVGFIGFALEREIFAAKVAG